MSEERYLVTPSLLNSWNYIWLCQENVRESEKDTISLEDKKSDAMQKAKEEFIKVLNREKSESNEYMKKGIIYEEETYKGNTRASKEVEGGAFQIVGTKETEVDGIKFLMYGRLDVLKGGEIIDIKKVVRYSPPKYFNSSQHQFYFELFTKAKKFRYLIDDDVKLHQETYYRSKNEREIEELWISPMIRWLIQNDLFELYKEKWKCKY